MENRRTITKWLYKFILIITCSTLGVLIFLKIQNTPRLLIDEKAGLPTLKKSQTILGLSIQQVQHYLLYLIIGLIISMLIIAIIQKKTGKIVYIIPLGASTFMAHHIMSTNTFFKIYPIETFSLHNLIQGYLPIILIGLFIFQLYLCNFIISSIFLPRTKTKLIDEAVKNYFKLFFLVSLPFLIYIALQN